MIVLTLFEKIKLLSLIERYQIELITAKRGEVTVRIHTWSENELLFRSLLERLIDEGYVYSVVQENDLLYVHYPENIVHDRRAIEALLNILDEFQLL